MVSSMVYNGNVVLVGDAGHSVWPSLGQGANLALETAHKLGEAFNDRDANLSQTLSSFNAIRKPQVDACGRLSQGGFGSSLSWCFRPHCLFSQ